MLESKSRQSSIPRQNLTNDSSGYASSATAFCGSSSSADEAGAGAAFPEAVPWFFFPTARDAPSASRAASPALRRQWSAPAHRRPAAPAPRVSASGQARSGRQNMSHGTHPQAAAHVSVQLLLAANILAHGAKHGDDVRQQRRVPLLRVAVADVGFGAVSGLGPCQQAVLVQRV